MAGSGYGDCVAAPIPEDERAPRLDGVKTTSVCVRGCLERGDGATLSMAGSGEAGDSVLSDMQRAAWRLTPRGDIAAASRGSGLVRCLLLMGGHRRTAGSAVSVGAAECR